jgi:hypothetical protein
MENIQQFGLASVERMEKWLDAQYVRSSVKTFPHYANWNLTASVLEFRGTPEQIPLHRLNCLIYSRISPKTETMWGMNIRCVYTDPPIAISGDTQSADPVPINTIILMVWESIEASFVNKLVDSMSRRLNEWLSISAPKGQTKKWMLTIDCKTMEQWDQLLDRNSICFDRHLVYRFEIHFQNWRGGHRSVIWLFISHVDTTGRKCSNRVKCSFRSSRIRNTLLKEVLRLQSESWFGFSFFGWNVIRREVDTLTCDMIFRFDRDISYAIRIGGSSLLAQKNPLSRRVASWISKHHSKLRIRWSGNSQNWYDRTTVKIFHSLWTDSMN